MTSDVEASPETAPASKSRIAGIVRWAARLTSIPVLALALVSLLPALMNYSVSARDDRIIALGLVGVCLGFVLAWRWPAVGGGVSLVSIGVVAVQAEGGLLGDPFSVAFALQAVLFFISSLLNRQPRQLATPARSWVRGAAVGLLAICALAGVIIIYRGPGPVPVPKEKERFLGLWDSGAGLRIEITRAGEAKVTQAPDAKVAACNTPVGPGEARVFSVTFRGDEHLELAGGALSEAKVYLIERAPHLEGKQMKMVLNASDPYQRTNGLVLVKKDKTN